MKRIFKKNQVIITALAIMIVVAGYLNFTNDSEILNTSVESMKSEGAKGNLDDATISASVEDAIEEEADSKEMVLDTDVEDIEQKDEVASNTEKEEDAAKKDSADASLDENGDPIDANSVGEAVLTNGDVILSEAKMNREQTRAKAKEMLLEIINNEGVSEEDKKGAIDKMLSMTERIEKESSAETQLAAKGFQDCVVTISDDSVDVTVNCQELSDKQRTQIEDIITRKTGVDLNQIVITTMSVK